MSSIMRRRSGLMAISVIGGSCLEDEVCEPLDPQDGTPPAPSPVHLTPLISSAALRAAPSRETGFVLWDNPDILSQGLRKGAASRVSSRAREEAPTATE